MTEANDSGTAETTVRLPRGLSRRIERLLEDESLGYGSFDDFVLAALRSELKRAERASYWLREGAR